VWQTCEQLNLSSQKEQQRSSCFGSQKQGITPPLIGPRNSLIFVGVCVYMKERLAGANAGESSIKERLEN
jgi:hypothetical protein